MNVPVVVDWSLSGPLCVLIQRENSCHFSKQKVFIPITFVNEFGFLMNFKQVLAMHLFYIWALSQEMRCNSFKVRETSLWNTFEQTRPMNDSK